MFKHRCLPKRMLLSVLFTLGLLVSLAISPITPLGLRSVAVAQVGADQLIEVNPIV